MDKTNKYSQEDSQMAKKHKKVLNFISHQGAYIKTNATTTHSPEWLKGWRGLETSKLLFTTGGSIN